LTCTTATWPWPPRTGWRRGAGAAGAVGQLAVLPCARGPGTVGRVTIPVDGIDRDFYVRQLKDWKFSVPIELMLPQGMGLYARLCG